MLKIFRYYVQMRLIKKAKPLPREVIPIETIVELYTTKKWPVARIATHLKVSQQNVYDRLNKQNVKIDDRRLSKRMTFSKELLSELYLEQGLSITAISEKLDCSLSIVSRELKRHGVTRAKHFRWRALAKLKIGESFVVNVDRGRKPSSAISSLAKLLGIRVIFRQIDDHHLMVKRTPIFSLREVEKLRKSGMTLQAISEVFNSTPQTVKRYLNGSI